MPETGILNGRQVKAIAKKIIENHPDGIKWSVWVDNIRQHGTDTPYGTITGNLRNFTRNASNIENPLRGLYKLKSTDASKIIDVLESGDEDVTQNEPDTATAGEAIRRPNEDKFYETFAEFVKEELGEANEILAFGRNYFRSKWGTPDVFGVYRSYKNDIVSFSPQIISGEIKTDPNQTIVAFGQACAYRLFSHRVYVVVPKTTSEEDLSRLEALGLLYGIGLITFDLDIDNPNYTIVVRAALSEPDPFHVNKVAGHLRDYSVPDFNRLFG